MFRPVIAAAAIAGALGLSACSSYGPTPYQPQSNGEQRGYSESRLEANRFRISFSGNTLTDRETVETYMLYRAAELTLQEGFDHFTIVRRDTDKRTRVEDFGPRYPRFSYHYYSPRRGWFPGYDPFWDEPIYREVTRYEATAEIVLGKGAKPSDVNAFDARDVQKNLSGKITRPQS